MEMLMWMEMKTANAEQRTLKIPLIAQYHGVSTEETDLANRIPTGKNTPISNPVGKITATDARIFAKSDAETMPARRALSANLRPMRHETVSKGYRNNQGARVSGKRSLNKLPIPALAIKVNRRMPRAYSGWLSNTVSL